MRQIGQAIYVGEAESGSKEWLEMRRKGIGGSDVAGILGLSRYTSPLGVWMDKMGIDREDDDDRIPARCGNVLEPFIAQLYTENTRNSLRIDRATYRHPTLAWALANLDGIVLDDEAKPEKLFEAKSVAEMMRGDWSEGVPIYYQTQGQHYLMVTGFDRICLGVLFGKSDFQDFEIRRDEDDIEVIKSECERFWKDYVLTKTPPPIDEDRYAVKYLLSKYGHDDDKTVDLPDEAASWVEQYEQAKDAEKAAQKAKDMAKVKLMSAIGQGKRGIVGDSQVTFVRTGRFDEKVARARYPEQVEECSQGFDSALFKARYTKLYNDCKEKQSGSIRISKRKK